MSKKQKLFTKPFHYFTFYDAEFLSSSTQTSERLTSLSPYFGKNANVIASVEVPCGQQNLHAHYVSEDNEVIDFSSRPFHYFFFDKNDNIIFHSKEMQLQSLNSLSSNAELLGHASVMINNTEVFVYYVKNDKASHFNQK
jgi:hypothetical protein